MKNDMTANDLIKMYKEAMKQKRWVEKNRPRLLENIRDMPEYDATMSPNDIKTLITHKGISECDRNIIQKYHRSIIIIDVIETALHERLSLEDCEIAEDIFVNFMRVKDVACSHRINEKTVWRIKQRALAGIREEINLRQASGKAMSSIFV